VKRVLLVGGSGQLGTAIARRWRDCAIVAPSHDELAIERTEQLAREMDRIAPDVLVNAAAFHDVDRCEREPNDAFEINAHAVGRAACLAAQRDALFVTISTDYVFDGAKDEPYTETDRPNPLSVYGASKLEGENLAQSSGARIFVVRTCGVYGPSRSVARRRPFIDRILAQHGTAELVPVVADVIASPTFAGALADALRALIESEAYGLYHAAGSGAVSWYDFACEAKRQARVDLRIEPIAAEQWKTIAIRPRFSALENAKLGELGIALPPWRDGIAAYLGLDGIAAYLGLQVR
jgi:dTDP-4-dehydrorhamnose reductase